MSFWNDIGWYDSHALGAQRFWYCGAIGSLSVSWWGTGKLVVLASRRKEYSKDFCGNNDIIFLTVFMGIILGRTFCGNICPFGALFEFVGKLNSKKIKVTEALNNKSS